MTNVTIAYSERAVEYTDALGSMSAVHSSDRHVVEQWAKSVSGRALDAGCGPGHWTNHLATLGVDVHGIDLVPEFVDHARAIYPTARFALGSIDALDEPDDALGGILSWFSTIHHEPSRIAAPLAEFARTLRPGGTLLLGHFSGSDVEAFDHAVARAYRWPSHDLHEALEAAGFEIIETHHRTERGHRPVGAILCELPTSDIR
ncbi:SAM-dependent methyltransferase [Microbacterium halimionae]|uniref:SAM-dependent methyltransferase n=1 Tax=Microbacterium halimionae TaxID=1526413 RepID=A0A7W3JRQ6_9MICO|nr:methyltransferase domain-containing protein [Microbacterium halimionae]MBA8817683.1 SAM-dependent methyltransferase [Microbacterium halimionae]NII94556.1 SAM-dependent methyltransferase [Microbacterium halimionae]